MAANPSDPRALRLAVVAVVFAGWLGYLAYQVATRPLANGRPLVVSRPQLLVSTLDVIAEVDSGGENAKVKVVEVLHGPEDSGVKEGSVLEVVNIHECRPPARRDEEEPPADWSGPGKYLLPLQEVGKGTYRVAPIPPSPGYYPPDALPAGPPRIYPANTPALAAEVRAQHRQVK